MGVSNSKLVQVLPPEGNGDGRIFVSSAKTNSNSVQRTRAPDTNKANVPFHSVRAKSAPNNTQTSSSFKNVSLQGSMDPIFEIPNQRARVRRSLIESHFKPNGHLSDTEEDENTTDNTNDERQKDCDNPDESTDAPNAIVEEVPVISQALYDGQLNVKQTEDSARCDVTGCVVFGGDKIAMTDNWNGCIKVFTLKERGFLSSIQLDMKPWDVTAMSPQQLVTTCNTSLTVLDMEPKHGSLSLNRVIPVEGRSRGVSFANDTFIVTFVQPEASVKLIHQDGHVIRVIQTDVTGARLFKRPEYVAVDVNLGLIYVSDFQTHLVTCLTLDGEVVSLYKNEDLQKPTGVALDTHSNVLVAGWGSENIHKISSKHCDRIQTVLHSRDIITYPQALTFHTDTMYISHYHFTSANNYLSAYRLDDLLQPIGLEDQ